MTVLASLLAKVGKKPVTVDATKSARASAKGLTHFFRVIVLPDVLFCLELGSESVCLPVYLEHDGNSSLSRFHKLPAELTVFVDWDSSHCFCHGYCLQSVLYYTK